MTKTRAAFSAVVADRGYEFVTSPTPDTVNLDVFDTANARGSVSNTTLGRAFLVDNKTNPGRDSVVNNRNNWNQAEQNFRFSKVLNEIPEGMVDMYADNFFSRRNFSNSGSGIEGFENAITKTFAHEIGHTLGLNHTAESNGPAIPIPGARDDIMAQGIDSAGTRTFDITANALRMALGTNWTLSQGQQVLDYFEAYVNSGVSDTINNDDDRPDGDDDDDGGDSRARRRTRLAALAASYDNAKSMRGRGYFFSEMD